VNVLALSPGNIASLVIALSFAAGLNLYLTVCALGIMARLHWVVLPGELGVLQNLWIIIASGILFAGDFFADKIPGFDVLWNALHTFIRIPIAALLAYAASSHLAPEQQLLVTCLGGVIAAIAHTSKTAMRVAVTPSPEPVSNIALSTAGEATSLGLTWAATHHPLIAGAVALGLTAASIGAVWFTYRAIRKGIRRFVQEWQDGTLFG
jgi:Domain of unknown function (DUF4126)